MDGANRTGRPGRVLGGGAWTARAEFMAPELAGKVAGAPHGHILDGVADRKDRRRRLLDIEEINQLKAPCFRSIDNRDREGSAQVFSREVALEVPGADRLLRGPGEMVREVSGALTGARTVHHGHIPESSSPDPTPLTARGPCSTTWSGPLPPRVPGWVGTIMATTWRNTRGKMAVGESVRLTCAGSESTHFKSFPQG